MKIDAHIHYNSTKTDLLEYGAKKDIGYLSIVTEIPGFPSVDDQLKTVVGLKKSYGDYLNFTTTFPCRAWGSPKWLETSLATIKKSLGMGAIGVKIWKNIGMSIQDKNGHYVMIDHASFEPIFNYLEENDVVVLGHNGEPRNCWLPMAEMTVESDLDYFAAHPEYHMYLHPEIPDYDQQLEARNKVLKRHPKLRFVGLHLASLEWDVAKVAAWLDHHPLAMVDLAERICHLQYQTLTHWQKVYDFFINYQDRIIYGTDFIMHHDQKVSGLNAYLDDRYQLDWDFFAKDNNITAPEVKGAFKGLGLPPSVLRKIYTTNAKNTYRI